MFKLKKDKTKMNKKEKNIKDQKLNQEEKTQQDNNTETINAPTNRPGRVLLVSVQKAVFLAFGLKSCEGVQMNPVQAVENTFFDIRICFFQLTDKLFDLLSFCAARFLNKLLVGKSAGALNKTQPVISCPGNDIVLVHAVQRTNQLHSLVVGAF